MDKDINKQPLSRDEKTSIKISILIALSGYLLAMFTCCDVFARFGALVVCVGIYFGAKGYTLTSSKIAEIADNKFQETIQNGLDLYESRRGIAPDTSIDAAKTQLVNKAKELKGEASRAVHAIDMRIIRVEAGIIMAGTLIWAFGDYLVLEFYISCSQC